MSSIEDRLNAVIRSGGTSTPAPAHTAKKAAPNSISERLDKVIASGKGRPSVYKAPTSTTKASTSKNQWVSTGGGRKSTTGAGKQHGFVADPTRAKNNASSRVKNIVTGATKSVGSAYTNLGGVLAEGAGKLNTRIANQNAGDSMQSDRDAVKRYEKMLRDVKWANGKAMTAADVKQVQGYLAAAKRRIAAHEGYTKAVEQSDKAVADKAYQKADRLSQSSAADVAQAKKGLGPVGQFAVDLGVQGVQMAGDVAASAVIPGAGLALMTARSAGSSAQRARQAGANYNQQLAYGLGSGALSLATEKISNVAGPFKKAFGGGVLDNAISGALSKLNNSAAGRVALSMISEGGEEFIEDIFQPILQRATYDPAARFDLSDALYDAAVGAAMGGIGAGVDVIRQRGNGQANAQPTQEARQEVREDTYTTAQAGAPDGTQTASEPVDVLSEVLFGRKRADLNTMTEAQQDAVFRANEEGTVGMDATGKVFQIDPEQHIDRRRMETVGGRDVNAFQFDHPELHRYYQEAANALIADADLSLQQPMSRRYERTMDGNAVQQAAQTSPHLRQAMDETGLSRDAIIDAAQRIITDHGQENVAAAKRVELILDDMLSHGYTTMTGEQVGPNSGYLNAKQSILGAGETQARGHGLDGVDGYDNLGSARQGFTTPGMEGTEQTSRLADSLPYDRYQESATGLTREDYAKLFRYESQTEGKSLHLAEELVYVKKDGQKTFLMDVDEGAFHELVRSLDDATAWNGPQMDAARMIQRELQGKADGLEIPETEYIDFLKIMREHETSTGQGVQANAKWSRKDNNGGQASELDAWDNLERSNLSDAEKIETFRQIVKWDTDIEAVKSGDTAAMKDIILDVAEARGVLNGVTGKESKALRSIAESSLNALTFDQLKQFAYASTSAMSTDATSANLGRKIKTIQILNMLSNPKTASKNVTGNTSFYALDALSMKGGALLDRAVSKLTGTRSMAADSVFSKGTREAAVKAMRMSIAEITMDVDMGGTNTRYGTGSQRTFKANGNFAERVISALERNQAYLLNATDEFYKGAARASEANTQRLIDEGKIKTSDKDYAKKQADQLSKYRTFQDDSKMSIAIQEIHDILNMALGVGDSGKTIKGRTVHSFGAGDIAAPFTRVAGNLVSRGAEYSPLNAVKGTVEIAEAVAKAVRGSGADVELQAKGVSNAARGLTGTAIAFGFMNLVKMGLMRKADDEDDEKVAALNRAEGMTGTQLNLSAAKRWLSGGGTEWQYGDTLIDLSSVEPLNLLMDLGAEMAKSEGNPVVSTFKAVPDALISASADLPVIQSVGSFTKDVFKYGKDPLESLLKNGASAAVSSVTPNALRAFALGMDDRPRSTGYADTFTERLAMEAKSRIPGLRETLPGSVDTLGNERTYQGTTPERLFNSMLNPVGVNHYQQGELSKELESLRERTDGNTSFYPTNRIPKEISFTDKNGKTHTAQMDYEQRQDFQRTRGTVTNGTMMAMTGTRAYKKASAERQVELMAKCQSYGYEVAKGSVLGKDSMEKWAVNAQTSKKDVGLSTVEFLALYTDDRYKSYLSGKAYEKTKEAYRAGVSVEEYVGLKESADTNGNGTISKAEASAALAGQENRADLWDIICTTNAKNPYK